MHLGIDATQWPLALARAHLEMQDDASAEVTIGDEDCEADLVRRCLEGAGLDHPDEHDWETSDGLTSIPVTKRWTLPDYVAPQMRLLICGLNPSPSSADSGVGFFRPGNRFWPAAVQAGIVTEDRDPFHALEAHRVGMTDMVKRTTRRADELTKDEYRAGVERVSTLIDWLQPERVCMVGLAGWRAAIGRNAQRGWQHETLAGRPVYLMSSTSGLNAHDTVDSLAEHLRNALDD